MNKIKITEQDVNRKFKTRDGRIFRIVRFVVGHGYYSVLALVTDEYASVDCKNAITLTDEGSYNAFTAGSSQYDFKEWADEDEKMGSKIELKVGQKVKFRNGDEGIVTAELDGERGCFFMIKYLDDLETCSYTPEGYFHENCDESEYDIVEILEEPKKKDVEEVKGKYELRLTVVDAKGSATTDKSYCNDAGIVGDLIHEKTDKLIKLKSLSDGLSPFTNLLRAKGDVVKITRQINILNVNIATITIRVTKLED